MSLSSTDIATMHSVELIARCVWKLGYRTPPPGVTWNGSVSDAFWRDLIQWILRPILGDVNPRYAWCNGADSTISSEWALTDAAIANAGLDIDPGTWQEGCRMALSQWSGLSV